VGLRLETVAFEWRKRLERHAERREARRRERFEQAQRAYRPPRYHLVERCLLMAVIGVACIMSLRVFGSVLSGVFETVGNRL
jgi:hypothetical protein